MRSEPPTGDELSRMLVSMKQQVLEQAAAEPAPAKRTHSLKRGLGLGLGIALLLGVGAGAAYAISVATSQEPTAAPPAQTFTPVASPTPRPTPSATPAPPEFEVEPGQPASRYGLSCDTLVDPALVDALFTTPVSAADPIVTASGVGHSIPRRTSIMAVGGTVCEWSNGVADNDQYGTNPDYVGLTISVTPQPAAGWNPRAAHYFRSGEFSAVCGTETPSCSASAGVNDAWVTMEADGAAVAAAEPTRWQYLFDAVVANVTSAGAAAPPSFVEYTEFSATEECAALLPLDRVRAITTLPGAEFGRDGGGWSDWAEARFTAGNFGCGWHDSGNTGVAANVDWVRGGRWAFIRLADSGLAARAEAAGTDEAYTRCFETESYRSCAVDFLVGDDWFNVAAADEATAIALAEEILQRSSK